MKGIMIQVVLAAALCGMVSTSAIADPKQDPVLDADARLPAVTHGAQTLSHTLPQWMDLLGVPGFSAVVIDDYRIAEVVTLGRVSTEAGSGIVTPDTVFQAASIAKAMTAIAVMREVEAGTLDLDADVNAQLTTWPLPRDDGFANTPVTLRHLLSHTAGVTEGGFPGYARHATLPSLEQILRGEAPATNRPARVTRMPGTDVAYSGLGYTVIQQILEDRRGTTFQESLDRLIFKPLGLKRTTFDHQVTESPNAPIARGHLANGLPVTNGWHVFPEQAAAGLWTTPSELAAIVIDVAKAHQGKPATLVSQATAQHMVQGVHGTMGLGFVVREDNPLVYFAHSGGNPGYYGHFRMLAATGDGVVILTNSEAGQLLAPLWMAAVSTAWDWPESERIRITDDLAERIVAQVARIRDRAANKRVAKAIDATILQRYVGSYELAPGMLFDITLVDGQLHLRLGDQPKFPLLAESETAFFLEAVDAAISFEVDAQSQPVALILHQGGRDQRAPRVPVTDTP